MKAEAEEEPVMKGRGRHGHASGANRDELDRERFMEVSSQAINTCHSEPHEAAFTSV